MFKFEYSFTGDERKSYKDIYVVIIYNWEGKEYDVYGMNVINCIPFLSKEEAEDYKEKFYKTQHGDCQAMIVQRY